MAFDAQADEKLPSGLLSAEELAERLAKSHRCPLPTERIVELANSGHLPCWWWQDGDKRYGPYFQISKVKEWLIANLSIREQKGIPFPSKFVVQISSPLRQEAVPSSDLPSAIQWMTACLYPVNHALSGVYFLISGNDIVYVGQSVNVASRVGSHFSESSKIFDRAVYLPVPPSDLDSVEMAFIKALWPKYNNENHKRRPVNEAEEKWLRAYGGSFNRISP